MKLAAFLLLIISSLLVTSCGFRLKGQYHITEELKTLHVSSQKMFSPLVKELTSRLQQNQVTVLDDFSVNHASIKLLPEQFQRRTLSLFPNGQVAEYELIYKVRYEVTKTGKEPQKFEFEISREFQDDPNNALAKERERQLLLSELRRVAADRIVSQLTTIQL
jgi:LPS-assembly lipoprotein